jgi:subtilisin family serine protease
VIDTGIKTDELSHAVILPGINLSGEGDPGDTSDPHGHGTVVAAAILRIAPGARLVPIKLMDRRGGLRSPQALAPAFDWILKHRAVLGVGIVCAAFADTSHTRADVSYRGSGLQQQVAALRAAGVAIVAAAGNWYPEHRAQNVQGMPWPAILRDIISVGAVERRPDGLWLTRTTQRLHTSLETGCRTTVFAEPDDPGETSGAAAAVVGCLAALRQRYPGATVDELMQIMLCHPQAGQDESGLSWPAVVVDDVLRRR